MIAESPRWDERTQELVWVDVFAGALCRAGYQARTGEWAPTQRWSIGVPLTSVAPLHDPEQGWVVATGDGLAHVTRTGIASAMCDLVTSADYPAVRTNDMVADQSGRLYVGLLAESRSNPRATVLRIDRDCSVSVAIPGVIAANGLGFSPDQSIFYLVDSIPRTLTAYPYDTGSGRLGPGEVIATWHGPGTFDGLAVDGNGNVWVAVWDAGVICCYAPRGDLIETYPTPVARPTALVFADPFGTTLVLTSARADLFAPLGPTQASDEGRLYAMAAPTPGPGSAFFRWTRQLAVEPVDSARRSGQRPIPMGLRNVNREKL